MIILSIVNFLVAAFLGYIIGRFGDNYLNVWLNDPIWFPHHWIFGFLLMILGPLLLKNDLEIWISSFGLGLFISDLKDFLDFKFFSKDNKTKKQIRFWHID